MASRMTSTSPAATSSHPAVPAIATTWACNGARKQFMAAPVRQSLAPGKVQHRAESSCWVRRRCWPSVACKRVSVARNGRAVGCTVVRQQAVEHHQCTGLHFHRDGRVGVRPRFFAELVHGDDIVHPLKPFPQGTCVPARLYPQAAVVQGGIFQRKPEGGDAHGRGLEEGGVLVPAHFATDAGLLEDVHGLPDFGVLHADIPCHFSQFRCARKRVEHRIQVVHGVADLVDRQGLGLAQRALVVKRLFFKKAAHRVVRIQKVPVNSSHLVIGGEDGAGSGRVKRIHDLPGPLP